ncbi:hypothetical protein DUI87_07761 [Hirundo rustica rustica]|uniref:Uncharacterized protein n=1 Tax=Hirundo rustica rustica TaxID=333673 RepID=A0A3M0KSA5_HIRRU|nr:hypothetical protein DUI87_07761 [Hirundo rustica rustica]
MYLFWSYRQDFLGPSPSKITEEFEKRQTQQTHKQVSGLVTATQAEIYNPATADVSGSGQDKGPQAVVKIIKTEEYKAMDMPVPSIKY